MFLLNSKNEKVLTVLPLSDADISTFFTKPNFYGIFFFENADGTLSIDDQSIDLTNNSISFYYPYQKLTLKGSFTGTFVQFHPDFFCLGIEAKDIGCQGLLFNNFFNDLLLTCSNAEFSNLCRFHKDVVSELSKNDIGLHDMIASKLKIFLIEAVRVKMGKQEKELQFKDNIHYQIEKLIEDNYTSESSPEFYADKLNISLSQFNRYCKRYFQNSFITVLNLKRIAIAKNELFLTDLPIKEIAYQTGFNDPLYFTRVFKKHCDISPTEFRKQLKSDRLI